MRLIDADEYRKRIDHYPPNIRDIAKKELRYVKTIDAEPVRHGHWVYEPKDAIEMMHTKPKCSECGYESADGLHYCSNCGARMKEMDKVNDD